MVKDTTSAYRAACVDTMTLTLIEFPGDAEVAMLSVSTTAISTTITQSDKLRIIASVDGVARALDGDSVTTTYTWSEA